MLQFGPRLGVRAGTRPSIASKDSIENNKPGNVARVSLHRRKNIPAQDHFEYEHNAPPNDSSWKL